MKKNKTLLSLLITSALFLIIYLIFGYRFENMDDILISRMLMDGYPTVFSFRFLSYISMGLHKIFNASGWGLILVFSTFITTYKLFKIFLKTENKPLQLFQFISVGIIVFDLLFQCQFTKVSTYVFITGYMLLYNAIKEKDKSNIIWGIILLSLGNIIRMDCIYILLPYAGIHSIVTAKNKKEFLKNLIVTFIIIVSIFGINKIETMTYSKEFAQHKEYSTIRASILDIYKKDFKDLEKLEPEISENDFYTLDNWILHDQDYFTLEKLEEIQTKFQDVKTIKIKDFLKITIENILRIFTSPLGILFLIACLFLGKRKNYLYFISLFFLIFVFSYLNRMPYRIESSIVMMGIITPIISNTLFYVNKKKILLILSLILTIQTIIHFAMPITFLNTKLPKEIEEINEIIEENPEQLYLYTFGVQFREYLALKITDNKINKVPKNKISASWDFEDQYYKDKLKQINIKNPIKEIIEKEIIIIQFKNTKDAEIISKYLEEHYNIKSKVETMDTNYEYFTMHKITKAP